MHAFLSQLAQQAGLLLFVLAFILVLIYALAPSKGKAFRHAARIPLEEREDDNEQ